VRALADQAQADALLFVDAIDHISELLRQRGPRQDGEAWRRRQDEVFRQRTHRLLLDNAVMDLRPGRFNTAKANLVIITFPPVGNEADLTWSRGVSTNRLHGCGRLMLHISQISLFAALDAYGEAMIPVDIVAYATRYVRAPPLASAPPLRLARTSLSYEFNAGQHWSRQSF
jgi:hypothetical protein